MTISAQCWTASGMLDATQGGGPATCPHCEREFMPRRKDMRFCHPNCRKAHSRGPQNSRHSRSKARHNAEFFETARRMGETLYSLPPQERLGHMKGLIDEARGSSEYSRQGNTQLRAILSNHKLIHPNPVSEFWLFPRSSWAYCTIAQAAQRYCKRYWHADVADVVYCRVDEPDTGEA